MIGLVHFDLVRYREGALVQEARAAELAASRSRRGRSREERERPPPEVPSASRVELVGERERAFRVIRNDLDVLRPALADDALEPSRVVIVDDAALGLRERRVRDVPDEAVPE